MDALLKAVRELPMAEPPEVEVVDGTATMTWPLVDGWQMIADFGGDEHGDVDLYLYDTSEPRTWTLEQIWYEMDDEVSAVCVALRDYLESLRWLVRLLIEMAGES